MLQSYSMVIGKPLLRPVIVERIWGKSGARWEGSSLAEAPRIVQGICGCQAMGPNSPLLRGRIVGIPVRPMYIHSSMKRSLRIEASECILRSPAQYINAT